MPTANERHALRNGLSRAPLALAAATLAVSASFALVPTAASAGFNIEGMIRGAIGAYGGGGRYHTRTVYHSRVHEAATHHRRSGEDNDADGGSDSDSASASKADSSTPPHPVPAHSDKIGAQPDTGRVVAVSDADEPSFSPSR